MSLTKVLSVPGFSQTILSRGSKYYLCNLFPWERKRRVPRFGDNRLNDNNPLGWLVGGKSFRLNSVLFLSNDYLCRFVNLR